MHELKKRGCFITIEGTEGAGKSTLATFIKDYLQMKGIDVVLTREPGGTKIAEEIRKILLQHNTETLFPKAEALLMFASRVQHVENKILPALNAGQWVISDRFADASYAYQGAGRALGFDQIDQLKQWSIGNFEPELTFLLDVSLELSFQRLKNRSHLDRIEMEEKSFFENIRTAYLQLSEKFKERYYLIDSSKTKNEVQFLAQKKIDDLINIWKK